MPQIIAEPNVFADELLDIVGQEFRFDHAKGLAEWLKNSADAYTREDVPDDEQVILIDIVETTPKRNSTFRVTDFVGMSLDDIVDAFKRWGDPRAAKRGTSKMTLGGHGNGGKFYMRQSFHRSQFVTYRNGLLNVYGFNDEKRYGFLDGYRDKSVTLNKALEFAGVDTATLPQEAIDRLEASQGFTVVIGEQPRNFSGRATSRSIIEKLIDHPQARRLIAHKAIFVSIGRTAGASYQRLRVENPAPRPDFENAETWAIPWTLTTEAGDETAYRDERWPEASLTLRTSRDTLRHTGNNRIDFVGEVGVIGSYDVHELGASLRFPAQAEFLYGECYCPKLEDPEEDCVKNDREKLVDNEKTRALLEWVRDKVDDLSGRIAEADARDRRHSDLSQSSAFNELLNQWKNRFMPKLLAELFGGPGEGSGFGGLGAGVSGLNGDEPGVISDGDTSDDDADRSGDQGGAGDERKVGPRTPTVLLSSYDADPLNPLDGPLECSPRHPAVYQRFEDAAQGIYWINTSRPLAQRIIDDYSPQSTRWRDYMFQRYVEIILKESLRELERKQGTITADLVDSHIDELYMRIHDQAEEDLTSFLFNENLATAE